MKIILIGFACSYKSTVGRLLAEKLKYKHIDTDRAVEEAAGKSVAEIFAQQSELEFRRLESRTLLQAAYLDDVVISCGGGGPLHSAFDKLAKGAKVVWLTSTATTVKQRLGQTVRPLFDGQTVEQLDELITLRSPYYSKYADITVSTDNKCSDEVAMSVLDKLRR